jgi:hypothetical protein
MPEQIRPDSALLERRNVDAVDPPGPDPRQIGFAQRQRQSAQIDKTQRVFCHCSGKK